MDPIRRNNIPPNIPNATPAGDAAPAGKTEKKFEVGAGDAAGGAQSTQSAGNTAAMVRPNFERMASMLKSGAAQSMTREELRDHVISGETKHLFGDKATPEMQAAVADAFREDPQLAQVMNRLLSKAGS